MDEHPQASDIRTLALAQGAYYAATGVWPLVSMRTFEAVTGPKTDHWLVNTVGALVGALGGVLLASAARGRPSPDLRWAAAASALALAAIDVYYSTRGRVSRIYLADAVAEVGLVALWARTGLGSAGRDAV